MKTKHLKKIFQNHEKFWIVINNKTIDETKFYQEHIKDEFLKTIFDGAKGNMATYKLEWLDKEFHNLYIET